MRERDKADDAPLMAAAAPASRVLLAAAALHACNDAFFALLFPLLPFIADELGLSYAEVGLIKAAFAGGAAVLQLPAGLLAERWGEYALLAWGNAWVASGLLGMAAASTFPVLLGMAVLGGLGGSVQHPLASSMVARAYEERGAARGARRATAIGTLNFAGDLGKMAAPALVALVALPFGWRTTLVTLGLFGLVFSLGIGLARPWVRPPDLFARSTTRGGVADRSVDDTPGASAAFPLLILVGILDSGTRAGALTFLPFALEGRGLGTGEIGLVFGLLFAGGAAGKLVCGPLSDRYGGLAVVLLTKAVSALALLGLVGGPEVLVLGLAAAFGWGLNGTSTVLYAAVAGLVPARRHARGYGVYYTGVEAAYALAPLAYGLLADRAGLDWTFVAMTALTLAVIPAAVPLRRHLAGEPR